MGKLFRPLRRGVVAVAPRGERLLVIRRSQTVVAPGAFCFPGGGLEGDETEEQALIRELREELGVSVRPIRRIWRSTTPWAVDLGWWLTQIEPDAILVPNPCEVESYHWHTPIEIAGLSGLLESNHEFLAAVTAGKIEI